jgi:hypothetical protein
MLFNYFIGRLRPDVLQMHVGYAKPKTLNQ